MLERAHALGGEVGVGGRGPLGEVGADELGERALQELGARAAEAHREGVVHLHDPVLAIGDDHEVDERVERVLEQAPLAQHLLEELDVLDAVRELTPEVAGEIAAGRLARPGATLRRRASRGRGASRAGA